MAARPSRNVHCSGARQFCRRRQRHTVVLTTASPCAANKVFADIAASAARLSEAYDATIYQVDADVLRLVAHHGPFQVGPESVGQLTLPLIRGFVNTRAVLDRQVIQVTNLQAEGDEYPEGRDYA